MYVLVRKVPEDVTNAVTRALILALGVCYHACLEKRAEYREYIATFFKDPCELTGRTQEGPDIIYDEINR